MKILILLALIVCITACSKTTLSQKECQTMNWFERGVTDGSEGKYFKVMDTYERTCAQGAKFDEKRYVSGYLKGMEVYCTDENGLRDGKINSKPVKTCKEGSPYYKGYEKGYAAYREEVDRRAVEKLTRPALDGGKRAGAPGGGGQ